MQTIIISPTYMYMYSMIQTNCITWTAIDEFNSVKGTISRTENNPQYSNIDLEKKVQIKNN